MVSRNDTSAAFESAVRCFEEWCHMLLLGAWQRAGMFKEPAESASVADVAKLNIRVTGISALGRARMIQAALDILVSGGLLRHVPTPACVPGVAAPNV